MAGSSAPAGSVHVEVVADLSKLDAGFREADARSKAAGAQIAGDLAKIETGAKRAEGAVEGLAKAEGRAADAGRNLGQAQDRAGQSAARGATMAERLATAWQRLSGRVSAHRQAALQAAAANDNIAGSFGRMSGSAASALGALLRFGAVAAIFGSIAIAVGGAVAALAALAATVPAVISAGTEMRTLERGFAAAAGSAEQGQREFNFIAETADRLGLSLGKTSQQFVGFLAASRGTALQGKDTRDIFVAVSSAMSVLDKSGEKTGQALIAVQQMMSKGKVSAEEMTGQLGEALPGALELSAKAMGMTQQALLKLMGDGKLLASDLLPKLAKQLQATYGDAAAKAANDFQANLNRLSNQWMKTRNDVFRSGFGDAFDRLVGSFASAVIAFLRENRDLAVSFGQTLAAMADGARTFGGYAVDAFYSVTDGARALGRIALDVAQSAFTPLVTAATQAASALGPAFDSVPGLIGDAFGSAGAIAQSALNMVIGTAVTAFQLIVAAWNGLPGAFADLGSRAANALISAMESAANLVIAGANKLIGGLRAIGDVVPVTGLEKLQDIAPVVFGKVATASEGAAKKVSADFAGVATAAMSRDYLGEAGSAFSKRYNELTEGYRKSREEARALATAQRDTENASRAAGAGLEDAGKGAKEAAKAAREAEQEFKKLQSAAEEAFKKLFPEDALRRRGEELQKLLDKGRDRLAAIDPRLVTALETEIRLNLDGKELEGVKTKTDDLSKEMSRTFSGVFDDMFANGDRGFSGMLDNVLKGLARLGSRAVEQQLSGLFSGGAAQGGLGGGASLDLAKIFDLDKWKSAISEGTSEGTQTGFSDFAKISQLGGQVGKMALPGLTGGAIGYQSGSPLMGALGGGISGFATGGPVGGVVGAVAGLIGGILGKEAKKEAEKRRREQERQEYLSRTAPQIEQLRAGFRGQATTGTEASIRAAYQEFFTAATEAQKAGDTGMEAGLRKDFETFAMRARVAYQNSFSGVMKDVQAGLGPQGPFGQAAATAQQLGEGLKAFVEDARSIADGGASAGKAYAAAVNGALATIEPPKELSETAQELARIRGTAAGLKGVLVDLGMSADAAAAAISKRTRRAIEAERDRFRGDLTSKINDAAGMGYRNDVSDLIAERKTLLSDAKALGISGAQVERYFASAAQGIVNESQLTGSAFKALVGAFPALRGRVKEFGEAALTAAEKAAKAAEIASRAQGYGDRLFAANNDTSTLAGQLRAFDRQAERERLEERRAGGEAMLALERAQAAERTRIIKDANQAAIDSARQAAQEAREFLAGAAKNIRSYLDELNAGSGSTLAPDAKLSAAQQQFDRQIGLARGGDRDAISSITQYADNLLQAGRGMYASGQGYQDIRKNVTDALGALPAQVDPTKLIVDAIDASSKANVAKLGDVLLGVQANSPILIAKAMNDNFSRLDIDKNGKLTLEEFNKAFVGLSTKKDQENLKALFDKFDGGTKGFITKTDIVEGKLDTVSSGLTGNGGVTGGLSVVSGKLGDQGGVIDSIGAGNVTAKQLQTLLTTANTTSSAIRGLINSTSTATAATNKSVGVGNATLTQIRTLNTTQRDTLTALNGQFAVTTNLTFDGKKLDNNIVTALNKIVYNTALTEGAKKNLLAQFDVGGYTGPGGRYEPAGIVHRGEIVWSQTDIARAGGVGAVEAMRRGANDNWRRGYADGGYVGRMPAPVMPAPVVMMGGGDNRAVVAVIDKLIARIGVLESRLAAATTAGAQHVRDGVDDVTDGVKRLGTETRRAADRPPTPGTKKAA